MDSEDKFWFMLVVYLLGVLSGIVLAEFVT